MKAASLFLILTAFFLTGSYSQSQIAPEIKRPMYSWSDTIAAANSAPKVIFFFASSGMPLSFKALPLLERLSIEKNYKLIVLNDPVRPFDQKYPKIASSSEYYAQGVYLHFPSILVFNKGKQCGSLIPGYKSYEGFLRILESKESHCETPDSSRLVGPATHHQTSVGRIVSVTKVPRNIQYYFKPVDQEWVTYHTGGNTFLLSRSTGQEIMLPGQYDSVPSPDGRYITIAGPLRFFSTEAAIGYPSSASTMAPLLQDDSMTDYYQSVGKIPNTETYRVVTAWNQGISFRDYLRASSGSLLPQRVRTPLCPNYRVATPIVSKDGVLVSAFWEATGGTTVFDIGPLGDKCDQKLNVGFQTGKAAFDFKSKYITFTAYIGGTTIGAYRMNLATSAQDLIGTAPTGGNLMFPDFLPNGNILYLTTDSTGQDQELVEVALPH